MASIADGGTCLMIFDLLSLRAQRSNPDPTRTCAVGIAASPSAPRNDNALRSLAIPMTLEDALRAKIDRMREGNVTARARSCSRMRNSIISSSAPARPGACWPTGSAPTAHARPAARGRRQGPQPVDPHPGRFLPQHLPPEDHLAVRDRAAGRARRPAPGVAARQGAGRVELDQRADLHPRPAPGFRPVAPARQYRLVLRRRAPVFPPRRTPGARRRPASRRRRPARRLRSARAARIARRLHRRAPSRRAIRATTISTAPSRTASARCS